ncbi:MAG: sigma factor [Bryobacteraceae bacterium]
MSFRAIPASAGGPAPLQTLRASRALPEIDDLLQEIFLIASRDLDRFEYRAPGSFFRWLSRIGDHVIADAARYGSREKRRAGGRLTLEGQVVGTPRYFSPEQARARELDERSDVFSMGTVSTSCSPGIRRSARPRRSAQPTPRCRGGSTAASPPTFRTSASRRSKRIPPTCTTCGPPTP